MNETNSSLRPFNVLLVEDNEDDVLFTLHAFKKTPFAIHFHVVRDGWEALQFLRCGPAGYALKLPDIILLDLNLPRMDGRQLLAELKRDERLRRIPVIILTTSAADDDISTAYRNHANAYMIKPIELPEFARRTRCLAEFWLSGVAILP